MVGQLLQPPSFRDARERQPGIHNHGLGLWIPGLRLAAHPGMTTSNDQAPFLKSLDTTSLDAVIPGSHPRCATGMTT
jgi:hypothetical protein